MWRSSVASVAFLCLGSAAALAGGNEGSPAPTSDDWTGFSVGAGIGTVGIDQTFTPTGGQAVEPARQFQKFDALLKKQDSPDGGSRQNSISGDDWNAFGTIQVGYDRLFASRFVLGAFADYDFYPDNHLDVPGGSVERNGSWTAGGRLGYLITPRTLVYGLGGYSQMHIDADATQDDNLNRVKALADVAAVAGGPGAHFSEDLDGWTVGGGIETKLDAIDKRLSFKIEYRYSQFDGDFDAGVANNRAAPIAQKAAAMLVRAQPSPSKSVDVDTDVQSVRGVLVWKLNP